GQLAALGGGAVLAGLLLQLALGVDGASRRLEAEVGAFATGQLAGGTDVTSHFPSLLFPSDAALLRRPAPVVRDGGDVDDVGDLVTAGVQRTHRRLATRARALDADLEGLHAVVEGGLAGLLGGNLGRERGGLAGTAEARAARGRPRQRVALAVGDGDDGVVERRLDVGDAVGDDTLDLLPGLGSRLVHGARSLLPDCLARALAGPGVGTGTLTAHRQAAAVTQAAVAAQVHQPLDRHADFATQVAFDRVLGHLGANALDFRLRKVTDLRGRGDAGRLANQLRPGPANAVDTLQAHPDMLLDRQVDTRNARQQAISKT